MRLNELRIAEDAPPVPTAAQHNGVLDYLLAQRLCGLIVDPGSSRPFAHPWRVTARRWEAPASGRSPLDPDFTWRVDVAAGTVNDQLASILYARAGDPRGWVLPSDYVEVAAPDPRWVERDPLDDLENPPCLVLRDPPILGAVTGDAGDFTRIEDAVRPSLEAGAFCGEDDWALELWRAHVILSASPLRATIFAAELPPPRLVRYRLYTTPKRPTPIFAARAGGWLELATVYLLRDPDAPEDAQIRIRQREWWNLWAVISQPGAELVNIFDTAARDLPVPDFFTDILRGELQDVLAGASTVHFWSV
jgi:hypothetical protein